MPAHAAVQRALRRRLLDHFVPLAREARRRTPRRPGAGAAGGNSVEEREQEQQQEQQEQEQGEAQGEAHGEAQGEGRHEAWRGARPGTRWRQHSMARPYSYSMLRASLRNESGKRLQHRREPELTRTPRRLRRVRTGYAYQPPALGTHRRRRAACPQRPTYCTYGVRVPATGVPYVPRAVAPRRERGALLAARRLGRRPRRTAQRGAALVPEMLAPVESVAVEASPG